MDAPPKKRKTTRKRGNGGEVIRKFISFLIFACLVAFCGYSWLQIHQLQQENAVLMEANRHLTRELEHGRRGRELKGERLGTAVIFDPVKDAQTHLSKAEDSVSKGNVGDAMAECKLVAADIQTASVSTSTSVRTSVAGLQSKLNVLQKQTAQLWHKLGV